MKTPKRQLLKHLKTVFRSIGYDLVPCQSTGIVENVAEAKPLHVDINTKSIDLDLIPDVSDEMKEIILTAMPYTMTSPERITALINAVTHVISNNIPGDIVECGVWRGGSMMAVALALMAKGDCSRSLYLYDTFEGMTPPTEVDKSLDGVPADVQLNMDAEMTGVWCYSCLDEVRHNMYCTGYPIDKIHFIKGPVEDTIPCHSPNKISILRLDTDWYASTKHELIHLYPLLQENGILIIDDYGHWVGAKKAVDDYFNEQGSMVYLHRIDYTGRILVKPAH